MTPPLFIGLDLSLTSTGFAVYGGGSMSFKTKPNKNEDYDTEKRLIYLEMRICQAIEDMATQHAADQVVVCIEGQAYAAQGKTRDLLAYLNWRMRVVCMFRGWEYQLIAPMTLKKFATGNGKADKAMMRSAALKAYDGRHKVVKADEIVDNPGYCQTNDEIDALWLAIYGKHHYDVSKAED